MTEDAPRSVVKSIQYQVVSAVGLGLFCLAQHWQWIEIPNLVFGALGLWMIAFPSPRLPLAFTAMAVVLQIYVHWELQQTFQFPSSFLMFDPTELLLAAGLLTFVAAQYRLIAIRCHVVPHDPRVRAKDATAIPQTRADTILPHGEVLRFVIAAVVCVVAGQVFWGWLYQNWSLAGFYPRFMQLATVIWLGIIGLFLGAGVSGYCLRIYGDAEAARMYLQEIDWQEARREYGRIGRWLAWGKAKAIKKWGKPPA